MKRNLGVISLAGLYLVIPMEVVNAQQAARVAVIEEVTVTAQRREESVFDVPIAITALSGDFLHERQSFTTESLSLYTPSLHIFAEAVNTEFYTIRGIGRANEDIASDSGVAVFIDDVYVPRQGAANISMFDIERVEVMRGPQGTLWGKNTTGGAINLVTRKPGDGPDAYVSADLGEARLARGSRAGLRHAALPLGPVERGRVDGRHPHLGRRHGRGAAHAS